jgi:hypothetical protein
MGKESTKKRSRRSTRSTIPSLSRFTGFPTSDPQTIPSPTIDPLAVDMYLLKERFSKEPDFDHPLLQTPHGDWCLPGFNVPPPFSEQQLFPSSAQLKIDIETAKNGFHLKRFEKPFALGGVEESSLLVDGVKWAKDATLELQSRTDSLFDLPCVCLIIGTIGSGKTSLIYQLITLLAHPKIFPVVRLSSPTAKIDPIFMSLRALRNPDVTFELADEPDVLYMSRLLTSVQASYAPFNDIALKGLYHHPESPDTLKLKKLNKLFHDFNHPYTNELGLPHGEALHLPSYALPKVSSSSASVLTRHFVNVDPVARVPVFSSKSSLRKLYSHLTAPHHVTTTDFSSPRDVSSTTTASFLANLNATHPDQISLQLQLQGEALRSSQPELFHILHKSAKPTLLIWDDCMDLLQDPKFRKMLSIIRHIKASAIISVQKLSGVPTGVRALCTNIFIARIPNQRELLAIEKEFGGAVSDFLGAYHAATCPLDGRTKDFLHIDLIKKKCFRSFSGELIPAGSSTSASWTPPPPSPPQAPLTSRQ